MSSQAPSDVGTPWVAVCDIVVPVSTRTGLPGFRVATWNVEAEARAAAVELLLGLRADVLLLTEVHPELRLPGYRMIGLTEPRMLAGQHYAAVAAREGMDVEVLEPPAVTSAAARVDGVTFVCTVLPWVLAPSPPYTGATQAEQVAHAVTDLPPWLEAQGELVWGGDWNHPLTGPLTGFTARGRHEILLATERLRLTVHTRAELAQPGRAGRSHAIDHIASRHPRCPVEVTPGAPHSTHDAYVVELPLPRQLDDAGRAASRTSGVAS